MRMRPDERAAVSWLLRGASSAIGSCCVRWRFLLQHDFGEVLAPLQLVFELDQSGAEGVAGGDHADRLVVVHDRRDDSRLRPSLPAHGPVACRPRSCADRRS